MKAIQNIIFDFGGVFLNIDFSLTFQAISQLCGKPFEVLFHDGFNDQLLLQFETGKISPAIFRQKLCERLGVQVNDSLIDDAWNAMLLDLPDYRIDLLRKVSDHYRVFLLSNTNLIHYWKYNGDFRVRYGLNFGELFEKAYWSHEIGLRKPDLACFKAITENAGIDISATVFIDDSYPNINGAKEFGLNGIHLTSDVIEIFENGILKQEL